MRFEHDTPDTPGVFIGPHVDVLDQNGRNPQWCGAASAMTRKHRARRG